MAADAASDHNNLCWSPAITKTESDQYRAVVWAAAWAHKYHITFTDQKDTYCCCDNIVNKTIILPFEIKYYHV